MAPKTRTLYVREEDQVLWDRAKDLIGESLSAYLTNHLRVLVSEKQNLLTGLGRIELTFNEDSIPVKKAFVGKWIISPKEAIEVHRSYDFLATSYSVAMTGKGNLAILIDNPNTGNGDLRVFTDVAQIRESVEIPKEVTAEIVKIVGVEVEELDI